MPYRPQFIYPPTPEGYQDEEFEYYFDPSNTPALGDVPGQKIPLQLQADAAFILRGIQISGNTTDLLIRFWTPDGLPISQGLITCDLAYDATLEGQNPVGRLPIPLEGEIPCPAGSVLLVDIGSLAS